MTTQQLLGAGTVGSIAFVITFLLDGATRPGYRPRYHTVSALALGARGWIQTANFVVCGALIGVSSIGFHRAHAGLLLTAAIAVFGISLIASGMFAMDPMRGYPPGTRAGTPATTSGRNQLHDWAGIAVFGSLPFAAGIAAFTLEAAAWAIYSALTAIAGLGTFIAFGIAWERDHPLTGLVQRVSIIVQWVWLAMLCWHLVS